MLGKLIGGGIGKGLLGGATRGLGKNLLGGGKGGPLKGLLGGDGPLKNLLGGEGGGVLGKALEAIGGPQGIMDLVQQIIDAAKNGQDAGAAPQPGLNPGAAAPKGAAPQAPAAAAGGANNGTKGGKGQRLLMRLAQKLADAKTPQDVDKVIGQLTQRLDAKGKGSPELKGLLEQLGQMRKASMQQAA